MALTFDDALKAAVEGQLKVINRNSIVEDDDDGYDNGKDEVNDSSSGSSISDTTTTSSNGSVKKERKTYERFGDLNGDFSLIENLVLDGMKYKKFSSEDGLMLSKFTNLISLSTNRTGLRDISHIPCIPSLRVLELTDNKLNEDMTPFIKDIVRIGPNIRRLEIGGNSIKTVEQIKPLTELKHLEQLGLEMTEVSETDGYREKVIGVLSQLKVLDRIDMNGDEITKDCDDDEDDEYADDNDDGSEEDTTLRDFYSSEYVEDGVDEEDEFVPGADDMEDEDEDDEDDEDEDDDEDDEDATQTDPASTSSVSKRKSDGHMEDCIGEEKKPRVE